MSPIDLSGRVTDLEKQILGLPTRQDYSTLQYQSALRFNTIDESLTDINDKFNDLYNKVINLQLFGVTGSTSGNHSHVFAETPAGTQNGVNDTFILQTAPSPQSSLMLFKNGLLQKAGSGNDYTLSSRTITFESDCIPQSGSNLMAYYTI